MKRNRLFSKRTSFITSAMNWAKFCFFIARMPKYHTHNVQNRNIMKIKTLRFKLNTHLCVNKINNKINIKKILFVFF